MNRAGEDQTARLRAAENSPADRIARRVVHALGAKTVLVVGPDPAPVERRLAAEGVQADVVRVAGTEPVVVPDGSWDVVLVLGDLPTDTADRLVETLATHADRLLVLAGSGGEEAAELRREIDELRHRLLTARDHAIGAEAEIARARTEREQMRGMLLEVYASTSWRVGKRVVTPVGRLRRVLGSGR